MSDVLADPEARLKAANLTAIGKYLKDNQIELPADDQAHKDLARKFVDSLPFSNLEEIA